MLPCYFTFIINLILQKYEKNSALLSMPLKFLCRVVLLAIIGTNLFCLTAKGVPNEPQRVTLNLKQVTLSMLFDELKKQTSYKFFHNDDQMRDMKTAIRQRQ